MKSKVRLINAQWYPGNATGNYKTSRLEEVITSFFGNYNWKRDLGPITMTSREPVDGEIEISYEVVTVMPPRTTTDDVESQRRKIQDVFIKHIEKALGVDAAVNVTYKRVQDGYFEQDARAIPFIVDITLSF